MNTLTRKQTRELRDRVQELALHLGPLTDKMIRSAIDSPAEKHWGVHYESRGDNLCQHCGHMWHNPEARKKVDWWGSDDPTRTVTCPHCGAQLRLDLTFHRKDSWYHCVLQETGGFVVNRMMVVFASYTSGETARHSVHEIAQMWYDGKGNYVRINRPVDLLPFGEQVIRWTDMADIKVNTMNSLTKRLSLHSVDILCPDTVAHRGFDGDAHGLPVNSLIHHLYTDNTFETVWKLGGWRLVQHRDYEELVSNYWKQVVMLLNSDKRDSYDLSTWKDYLGQVAKLKKMADAAGIKGTGYDLNNRFYVLPDDLPAAHQRYTRLIQRKYEEQRHAERLQKDLDRLPEMIEKFEPAFEAAKSRYFGIHYENDSFAISTLSSIQEYFDYGKDLRHCVFHNNYWEKKDTLVLGVVMKASGKRFANIEMELSTGEVLQCYGKDNVRPDVADELAELVKSHYGLYKTAARKTKKKSPAKPALVPVFA